MQVCTVHSESIQTPIHCFQFFLINLYSVRHNDSENRILEMSVNLLKRKKLKYHIYIRIQTLCNNTWNLAQVPPISLDHCRDVSTPWLESTCGKLNWLDMIWKSTDLSIKCPIHKCTSEQKPSHEVKGTACRAQRQDCIEAQIWGRLQKIAAALRISKSTVASIILKCKMFGTTRTLPRAGRQAKLSN